MSLFTSTQPSLRARVLPRFPANVVAGNLMQITKNGTTYTFSVTPYANIPITAIENIPTDSLLGRDTVGSGSVENISPAGGLIMSGGKTLEMSANSRLRYVAVTITGSPITTGIKTDFLIPFLCTISKVTLLADQVGSIVIDIWKDTFGNFPPTVADTITASAKPTLSSANKSQDSTLTGWNTTINAGDILRFNVDSVATVTRVVVALDVITV